MNRQRHDIELVVGRRRKELEDVTRKLDGVIEAIADGLRAAGLLKWTPRLEPLGPVS